MHFVDIVADTAEQDVTVSANTNFVWQPTLAWNMRSIHLRES